MSILTKLSGIFTWKSLKAEIGANAMVLYRLNPGLRGYSL